MHRDQAGRFTSVVRGDSMISVLTGLGDPWRDKAQSVRISQNPDLTQYQVDALYQDDGFSAKVVDMPANDLTREGVELQDIDVDLKAVDSAIEDFEILGHISDLYRWGSAYGGALLGVAVDDGLPAYEPLDRARVARVRGLFVLNRHEVNPIWSSGRVAGDPDGYTITTDGPETDAIQGRVIHASRTIKFIGSTPLSRAQRHNRLGWGVSVYKRIWERLRRLLSAYGYGETILQDVSVDVFQIAGLAEAIKRGDEDLVRKRLMALQMGKDVLHGIALDAGDEKRNPENYIPQSRSVTGIRELIELFLMAVVAAVPIPRSEFLGETVGGLNTGTNSGEKRTYNAFICSQQSKYATRWLTWILELLFASKEGPTRGVVPPRWTTQWASLMAPTDVERAELAHKRAQTDELLWRTGGASSDDIRYTRIEKGSHGDLEERPDDEDPVDLPDEDEAIAAAAAASAAPVDAGAAEAGSGSGGDVQASALNGAQMKEIRELGGQVVRKELPIEFAAEMLMISAPGIVRSREQAMRILESLRNFEAPAPPAPAVPPPMPGAAPATDDEAS